MNTKPEIPVSWRLLRCGATFLLLAAVASAREHVPLTIPFHKFSQTLIASADLKEKSYLVVPVSLQVGPDELLIGMKRGDAHARDREAVFEINAYRPSTGRMQGRRASLGEPLHTYYNGEFVRHANGAISCFVDVQQSGAVVRLGLRESRLADGGRTFSAPRRVGPIDGVEYGYVFGSEIRDGRTYLLAMRFANLVDGYYATAHWRERDGVVLLNIVTYKRADFVAAQRTKSFHDPDLSRLEFVWDEVK